MNLWLSRWAVAASLVAVVALVFATGLNGSFQFDDWNIIVDEQRVQSLVAWWQSMPGIRPLMKLSLALNWELERWLDAGPAGFRAVNIALHAFNSVCVYRLLSRLGATDSPFMAAVGALVFALHPVQTEAVTYISGRSDVLMASFALLSLLLWQQHRQLLSAFAFLLACASKETAVVLPAVLWLCYWMQPRRESGGAPWPQTVAVVLVVLAMALSPVYRALLAYSLELRGPIENLLLVQPGAVLYLLSQLWRFDRLNADPMLAAPSGWGSAEIAALAIVGAGCIAGLAWLRRRPQLAFGLLWFLLWLAPTHSLWPRTDLVNERQLYLAIIGPAWLLGLALTPLLRQRALVVVMLATVLAFATLARNEVYRTEAGFWEDVALKSPHNPRAANNLGLAYARACRTEAARTELRRALQIDPGYYLAANNLALLERGYFCTQAPASF
jgi:protein O-mannosyl-transferase